MRPDDGGCTLANEWAYARLYTSDAEYPRWLHTYNHDHGQRPHRTRRSTTSQPRT